MDYSFFLLYICIEVVKAYTNLVSIVSEEWKV